MQNKWMNRMCAGVLAAPLLLSASVPAIAQDRDGHGNFYQGARDGGRDGGYGGGHHDDRNYHQDRNYNQGGIGPGKGAAIGGIGGAVLGAAFGGGLKGAVIGGAAGAGIGAIAGQAHQNNQRRQYYNGRPY